MFRKYIIYFFILTMLLVSSGCQRYVFPEPQIENQNKLSFQAKVIDEETTKYFIDLKYPIFEIDNKEIEEKVNSRIEDFVDSEIVNFKMGMAEFDDFGDENLSSSINMNFFVDNADTDYISFYLMIDRYTEGAMHGFKSYLVFNYNLNTDKNLYFKDVFNQDSDFLNFISQKANDKFNGLFGTGGWFPEGVDPIENNFEKFVFDENSIIFLFEDYQVVAYVAGPQELEVNIDEIKDYLNSSFFSN